MLSNKGFAGAPGRTMLELKDTEGDVGIPAYGIPDWLPVKATSRQQTAEKRAANSFVLRLVTKREYTVTFSDSPLRPLDRKTLRHILDKNSETSVIPRKRPVTRAIKLPITYTWGHFSLDSNLTSDTVLMGAGQAGYIFRWFYYTYTLKSPQYSADLFRFQGDVLQNYV